MSPDPLTVAGKAPAAQVPSADLEALAATAARAGAAAVREWIGRPVNVTGKSTATDPVTEADRASEAAVVAAISRQRPGDGIVGEEGTRLPARSGFRWVIDPLDGTVNFLYGLPNVAVSVACEKLTGGDWQPVAGAVHDVWREETFSAAAGLGAHLDGAPITIGSARLLAHALVGTGFSYQAASRARQSATLARLLPRVRDVRSSGSAAIELCWVAAGRCDAYYEDELAPWDTAAGRVIVSEAGGRVTDLAQGGVLAANPVLFRQLRAVVDPSTSRATPPPDGFPDMGRRT